MYKLIISKSDISARASQIDKALKLIIGTGSTVPSSNGPDFTISIIDSRLSVHEDARDKFTLYKRAFLGRYREVWKAQDAKQLYLHLAYLEIYAPPTTDARPEILALHCDPTETRADKNLRYKLSPHMHINAAVEPFPKAHIALYLDNESYIYESMESFNAYLKRYSIMLKEQFIDNLDDNFGERISRLKKNYID